MPDFSKRDTTPELMDAEVVRYEELRGALRQLTQANELSFAYRPTLSFFKRLAREGRLAQDRPIIVIDAASGYGDMSRKVDAWAARNGINLEIVGIDMKSVGGARCGGSDRPWPTPAMGDRRPLRLPRRRRRRHYYEFPVHPSSAQPAARSLPPLDGGECAHRLVH